MLKGGGGGCNVGDDNQVQGVARDRVAPDQASASHGATLWCKLSGEIRNSMQMDERHVVPELTHQRSGSSEFSVAVVLSWFGGRVLGDFLEASIVRAQL